MLRKRLTIDTSFDIEENQPRITTPQYCTRQDYILKLISISLLATFYAVSLTISWWFSPMWATISLIHRIMTFCCYAFVIMSTDLDEILNIKHSKNEKLVFCRFVSYCDWVITFIEVAEGLLLCIENFIKHGSLLSPYILYSSIAKFILYVYLLRNV